MSKSAISRLMIIIIVVVAVVVIVGVAAYMLYMPAPPAPTPTPTPTPKPTPTPTPTPTEEIPREIKIGAPLALSGWGSIENIPALQGMQIAVDWINRRGGVNFKGHKVPIKLIYYDFESNDEYAIKLTEKLIIEDKAHIVMQPWGPFCVATAPVTEKHRFFSVLWAGAPDFLVGQGYKYMIAPHNPLGGHFYYALRVIRDADPNAKTVANIYRAEPGAVLWGEAVRKYSPEFGLTVIYDKSYPPDITDATPILREIATAKPDILCVGCIYPDGYLIATQLRDLKINIKWIIMQVAVNKPDFGKALGKWAVGFMIDSPYEPEVKWEVIAAKEGKEYVGMTNNELLTEYYRVIGEKSRPATEVGMAASGIFVAVKCIEEAQSLDADKLMEVAKRLDFYTCRGRFKIDPKEPVLQIGTPSPPIVAQWQRKDNKLTYAILYPYDFATAKVIPMPTWEEKEAWPELELQIIPP